MGIFYFKVLKKDKFLTGNNSTTRCRYG